MHSGRRSCLESGIWGKCPSIGRLGLWLGLWSWQGEGWKVCKKDGFAEFLKLKAWDLWGRGGHC